MTLHEQPSHRISRRQLVLGPFQMAAQAFKNASSENAPGDPGAEFRDKYVERIGETATLFTLVSLAYLGSQDRILTYKVDSEGKVKDLTGFQEKLDTVNELLNLLAFPKNQASALYDAWSRSYVKTRIVCSTTIVENCDSKGHCTSNPVTTCVPENYWDEPEELTSRGIDHNRIDHWKSFLAMIAGKTGEVKTEGPKAFDLSSGENGLFYPEKIADKDVQLGVSMACYGLAGLSYMFYEEGFKNLAEGGYTEPFVFEGKYIKRRTFFKLMTSLILSLKIRDLQLAFVQKNKGLLSEIQANTRNVLSRLDIDPNENFKRFFGILPLEIRNTLVDMETRCNQAVDSGYDGRFDSGWEAVKTNLDTTRQQATRSISDFDSFFSFDKETGNYEIPKGLTEITKYLWATREIMQYARNRSADVIIRHPLNALVMALGLFGIAITAEKTVFPAMDKAADRILEHEESI